MFDPRSYVVQETLKNGMVVTVRAARPGDGDKIREAFKNLERETVYTRFFGFKSEVTDAELERVTGADFNRDVALLVTIGCGEVETVIGGASYFTIDEGPDRTAELALTVEEDYQGLGIASILIGHLVQIARQNGLSQLEASVLTRNLSMLAVFRRSGLPSAVQNQGDSVHVTLSLPPLAE